MCGGDYKQSKGLIKVNDERLIERTIRLLKDNGINDIAITTNGNEYDYLGVEIIHNENNYKTDNYDLECTNSNYSWLNAYYITNDPVCYLHGDVYFSEEAIKRIVEAEVEDTLFICTCDGSDKERNPKNVKGREPFGFKVVNQAVFQYAIKKIKQRIDNGEFKGHLPPLSWHVYRFLNGLDIKPEATKYTEVNDIFKTNGDYLLIDDISVDIDTKQDLKRLKSMLRSDD